MLVINGKRAEPGAIVEPASNQMVGAQSTNGWENFLLNADYEMEDYSTNADLEPEAHRSAEDKGGRDNFGIIQFDGLDDCVRDHVLEPPSQLAAEFICAKKDEDEANVWSRCNKYEIARFE